MAAAYRLTDPALGGRFEVTVHQQGWRLGGKAASGRDRDRGYRIEEHGLHLFMGWYDHAFGLVREVYDEWRPPPGSPLATWDRAFVPERRVVLSDRRGTDGPWAWWDLPFPPRGGSPGDRDVAGAAPGPPHPEVLLRRLVGWLPVPARRLGLHLPAGEGGATWDGHVAATRLAATGLATTPPGAPSDATRSDETPLDAPDGHHAALRHRHHAALRQRLHALREHLIRVHGPRPHDLADDLREAAVMLHLGVALALGLLEDVAPHGHEGWSRIDDRDLRDWLEQHGAHPEVAFSGPIRSFYDLAFAWLDGDTSDPANARIAAGAALRTLLRTAFDYRDAPLWRMTAGMGDVVFTPLYQVLRARGVSFRFFHRVERLRVGADRTTIDGIDVLRQVALHGDTYDPLERIEADGPLDVWPSTPRWEQVRGGTRLAAEGVDLESAWCGHHVGRDRLRRGEHFDEVVLGISLGGLSAVAAELLDAQPRWRAMVDGMPTVETQSVQLWTDPDLAGLGWRRGPMVGSGYAEPFDSFADVSQVLPAEVWGPDAPGSVQYLVAPLRSASREPRSDPHYPARQHEAVRANARAWLETSAARIYPDLVHDGRVRWELLHDPDGGRGPARLDVQYVRANVDPSERYVLTPPGTVGLRLDPADCGFGNLAPAGDWVRTSVNGGSAEAAVEGGLAAGEAIVARHAR
jgi:uncharacterized protein with NAD-binding domain and iron-sulfur cluster